MPKDGSFLINDFWEINGYWYDWQVEVAINVPIVASSVQSFMLGIHSRIPWDNLE